MRSLHAPADGAAGGAPVQRLRYAAFLAEHAFAVRLMRLVDRHPEIETLLNDSDAALGLPAETYAAFKEYWLGMAALSRFLELRCAASSATAPPAIEAGIAADLATVSRFREEQGAGLALAGTIAGARRMGLGVWFPIQRYLLKWMGDTRLFRRGKSLISAEQAQALPQRLRPGDILVERREWFISNIGLPGYWTHAGLYVGTPDERRRYFNEDAVRRWVRSAGMSSGDFEELLRARYPDAHRAGLAADSKGHPPRVLEAISEGVVFTPIEHRAEADSLAVLRPRVPKVECAASILRAFGYWGRPYDFNFNYLTDSTLACTELIHKAYESSGDGASLDLPAARSVEGLLSTANDLVRHFAEERSASRRPLEFVLFLDGDERSGRARPAEEGSLRRSWRRPPLYVWFQRPAAARAPHADARRAGGGKPGDEPR